MVGAILVANFLSVGLRERVTSHKLRVGIDGDLRTHELTAV